MYRLVLLITGLLAIAAGSEVCIPTGIKRMENIYYNCLAAGFNSTKLGCSTPLNGKSLSEGDLKACVKVENRLKENCRYSCRDSSSNLATEAPARSSPTSTVADILTSAPDGVFTTAAPEKDPAAEEEAASLRAECTSSNCYNAQGAGDVILELGKQLDAPNDSSHLKMHNDGNLVLYCTDSGKPIWRSGTDENTVKDGVKFQKDGNLVMYAAGKVVLFDAECYGQGGVSLELQDDSNLVIYQASEDGNARTSVWSSESYGMCASCTPSNCYNARGEGEVTLENEKQLVAPDGSSHLDMQDNGNLVLYCTVSGKVIWSSGTNENTVKDGVRFLADGNLVIYDDEDNKIWEAINSDETEKMGGMSLELQNDNNLVIYVIDDAGDKRAAWSTESNGDCSS